jgi:hypothetical protein
LEHTNRLDFAYLQTISKRVLLLINNLRFIP